MLLHFSNPSLSAGIHCDYDIHDIPHSSIPLLREIPEQWLIHYQDGTDEKCGPLRQVYSVCDIVLNCDHSKSFWVIWCICNFSESPISNTLLLQLWVFSKLFALIISDTSSWPKR